MNLEQALAPYIGRQVEVFTANNFLQGTLSGVGGGILSVDAVNSSYTSASGPVSVPIANLTYVRVIA